MALGKGTDALMARINGSILDVGKRGFRVQGKRGFRVRPFCIWRFAFCILTYRLLKQVKMQNTKVKSDYASTEP
jgi:hypothetical protein